MIVMMKLPPTDHRVQAVLNKATEMGHDYHVSLVKAGVAISIIDYKTEKLPDPIVFKALPGVEKVLSNIRVAAPISPKDFKPISES